MLRFILLLSCTVACILGANFTLPLNRNAPFAQAVQSINHNVLAREVSIELRPARKCLQPTFRVRISGTALYILDLHKTGPNSFVYGYPKLIDEGDYFIEVLILFCNAFNPNGYAGVCLENVEDESNVVTQPYLFRHRSVDATHNDMVEQRPRWRLSGKNHADRLLTRYQRDNCPNYWCVSKEADLWQYNRYEWTSGPNYTEPLTKVLEMRHQVEQNTADRNRTVINVCMVGDSHARTLTQHGTELGVPHVKFTHLATTFPVDFEIDWFRINLCSYAVIAYGQWPASHAMKGRPYTQDKFREEMRRVMVLLQSYNQPHKPNQTQVFVRSVNYNGINVRVWACPPLDYRTPPVIDAYNAAIKNLTSEYHIDYIDLNHIMGPMWDSALDYCHPVGKVATAEIEWILAHILQYSVHHKQGVVLQTPEFSERTLIRFADSATVYLYTSGELHAFPHAQTLVNMGYAVGDTRVLNVEKKLELKIGAVLPAI